MSFCKHDCSEHIEKEGKYFDSLRENLFVNNISWNISHQWVFWFKVLLNFLASPKTTVLFINLHNDLTPAN